VAHNIARMEFVTLLTRPMHPVIDRIGKQHYSRFCVKTCIALFLLIVPGMAATGAPKFPSPPDANVGKLGDDMIINGMPMNIRQFTSLKSVNTILEYYRDYWPRGTEEKPGYTETDALQPWKIITRVEDGYIMTVQVTEQNERGSHGLLSMSKLPDLDRPLPGTGNDFPKMKGSIVINDLETKDIGKRGRTLQLFNRFSVESNANYYRDHFTNSGWATNMDQKLSDGNGYAQRFTQGNNNIIISINKTRDGSIIVAQSETLGW
jgi:hypothetical protein